MSASSATTGGYVNVSMPAGPRGRGLWWRSMVLAMVLALLAPLLVAVPFVAPPAASAASSSAALAELPPGGVVDSVAETGWTKGMFSVSHDGAAQYELPLWTPPGRGDGVVPKLSLSFNSRAGDGLLGVGWSLTGLPSITPCPRTWAQDGFTDGVRLNSSDVYCLGGNRLLPVGPASNGTREFRTEQESFAKVVAHGLADDGVPDYFTVFNKDRTIMTLGGTDDSRLEGFRLVPGEEPNTLVRESTTDRVIVSWSVNEIKDRNGNAATVTYEESEGDESTLWHVHSRLKSITYAPNREVLFIYSNRSDHIEGFVAGVHTLEPKRLTSVVMSGAAQGEARDRLRLYKLDYDNYSITGRSLLTRITECDGGLGTAQRCLLPLPLQWTTGSREFETIDTGVTDAGQPFRGSFPDPRHEHGDYRIITVDVNRDGRGDILYPRSDGPLEERDQTWRLRLNTGGGFGEVLDPGFTTPTFVARGRDTTRDDSDPIGKVVPIDVDANGRTDLMVWETQSDGANRWRLFVGNGSGFSRTSTLLQTGTDVNEVDEADPVFFGDVNGDGRPDFITATYENPNSEQRSELIDGPWHYRLNQSRGPGFSDDWSDPVNTGSTLAALHRDGKVMDSNSDGRADLLGPRRVDQDVSGWGLNAANQVEVRTFVRLTNSLGSPLDLVSGDVNGDGLADAISPYTFAVARHDAPPKIPGQLRASLNAGTGFGPFSESPEGFWEPQPICTRGSGGPPDPPLPDCDPEFDRGVRYADFNGDGADDVIVNQCCFEGADPPADDFTGTRLYTWRNGQFIRDPLRLPAGIGVENGYMSVQILDFDADGMLDILQPLFEGGDPGSDDDRHSLRILRRKGGKPDQLVGIGDQKVGERIDVEYSTLADRSTPTGQPTHVPCTAPRYPQVCQHFGGSIVKSHLLDTGRARDLYLHSYKGARMDLQGRGWLGFNEHRVVRSTTGETTVTEFDNVSRDTRSTSVYPFANRPKKVTTTVITNEADPDREYRRTTVHDPVVRRTPTGSWFVAPGTTTEVEQERSVDSTSWNTLRESTTTTQVDGFGNPTVVDSRTTDGRTSLDDIDYINNTDDWLIGLANRREVRSCTDNGECKTRTAEYGYYPNGNPEFTTVEPDDPKLKLTTTTVYGDFGEVKSVTKTPQEGESRIESFEYDADFLHPTVTVNALEHRTQITTHSGLGVQTEVINPNVNEKTTMVYDRFGRPVQTNRSDGSAETIVRSFDREGARQRVVTLRSDGARTQVFSDRLGREIENRVRAFDVDGNDASVFTEYDVLGRVERVSRPMFPDETPQFTVTGYDKRDRVTSVRAPDEATVTHEYINRQTTTTDSEGGRSVTFTTVNGDIAQRHEDDPDSGSPLITIYTHGPFGELNRVRAPDLTNQVMTYDTLGQRTSLEDPNAGTMTTTYTPFGEVDTETNAEGELTDYDYDALGRVKKTTSKDGVAVNKYDTAPNGIGRLASARSGEGVGDIGVNYRWTKQGQPQSVTWQVNGDNYTVDYGYDSLGRRSTMTYPEVLGTGSRLRVSHIYNAHGYLSQVKDSTGLTGAAITAACSEAERADGRCFWTANEREADGQLRKETYGNGTVTDLRYEPKTGQLTSMNTTGPGDTGVLAVLSYDYDLNRNVTGRADRVNDRADVYTHDVLNRLETWTATQGQNQTTVATYSYDKAGNLELEEFAGEPDRNVDYGYGTREGSITRQRHTMTSRNGSPYTYDRAGRQLTGGGRTIDYTARNLPKTIVWGQNDLMRTEFAYDPDGAMVAKSDSRHTLISIPGILERRTPAGTGSNEVHTVHHINVEGRTIAQVTHIQDLTAPRGPVIRTKTWHLHHDLQGSVHLATNPAGGEVGNEEGWIRDLRYDPWGQRIDTDDQPLSRQHRGSMARTGYTGHDHHDELGLIDMKGRVYDPEARRFISPDPIIQDPLASQSYNRYAYVQNNPVTLTDPTGFQGLPRDQVNLQNLVADREVDPSSIRVTVTEEGSVGSIARPATAVVTVTGTTSAPNRLNISPAEGTSTDSDSSSRALAGSADADTTNRPAGEAGGEPRSDQAAAAAAAGPAAAPAAAAGASGFLGKIHKFLMSSLRGQIVAKGLQVGPLGEGLEPTYDRKGALRLQTRAEAIQADVDTRPSTKPAAEARAGGRAKPGAAPGPSSPTGGATGGRAAGSSVAGRAAVRVGARIFARVAGIAGMAVDSASMLNLIYTKPTPPVHPVTGALDAYRQAYGQIGDVKSVYDGYNAVVRDGGGIRIHR